MNLNLHDYRNTHKWRVEETAESLFFIAGELPNPKTKDMQGLFESTDKLHERVRTALNRDPRSSKVRERQQRVNVWLYPPTLLQDANLGNFDKPRVFYGTANSAGLHLVTRAMAWDDAMVLQRVLHEIVHYWWADEVGDAPSLLNEGVATYYEHTLWADAEKGQEEMGHGWREYVCRSETGFLRRLCKNDAFWCEHAEGEPVYEVGGRLVAYLLDTYGLPNLRRIFLASHFDDQHLPQHIEDVIGESIDSLEKQVDLK